ncbi:MAG: hypothetical protein Q4P66_08425 [Actinomycetaceae bacterium]|nr:hypothetical protein [Actinomycetaceae bacterium]
MESKDMSHIPSDQALEQLLAQTRAQFSEQVDDEAERLNRDLDALLYRVRGSRRASRSAALRAKAQSFLEQQREEQSNSYGHLRGGNNDQDGTAPQKSAPPVATHTPTSQVESHTTPSEKERLVLQADLKSIGIPDSYTAMHPKTLTKLCSYIPQPVRPQAVTGKQAVAVLGHMDDAQQTISTARHLAMRTPGEAHVILCGAKTLLPGQGLRARNTDDLQKLLQDHSQATCYVVFIDAAAPAHARMTLKMIEETDIASTWVVVNALEEPKTLYKWLLNLPGHLSVQALAFFNVWEAQMPGHMLEQSVPVSLLEGAPATAKQWELVFEERLTDL